jgi:hypothetical protein
VLLTMVLLLPVFESELHEQTANAVKTANKPQIGRRIHRLRSQKSIGYEMFANCGSILK